MALIEWKEDFSVGISTLDAQHKKLIRIINKLYDGMTRGPEKKLLSSVLDELEQYTKIHFSHEERLMNVNAYPHYRMHKDEHDKLTAQVDAFVNAFDAGRQQLTMDVLLFLKNWLEHHILETDKLYSEFLVEKGAR